MKAVTVAACLGLAGYAVARAVLVPLTYDEAASYLRYISQDFLSVFNFEVATNHFLNTLPTKLAAAVAGDSELVLRLPSLMGYAVYLYFSILIVREIPQRTIAIAGFVLLQFNPYLLDYFALSRGYGMSLGLLMGASYFLLRFASQRQTGTAGSREITRALMFGCGAVLASFSLLDAYLGIVAVVLVLSVGAATVPGFQAPGRPGFLRIVSLPVTIAVFTFLVLSQDHRLTHRLYEPVTITFIGLDQAELDAVRVSRMNLRRRPESITRQPGVSIWRVEPAVAVRGLRLDLPLAAAEKIRDGRAFVETLIANRPFILRKGHNDLWAARDAGSTVMFETTAMLSLPRSRMAQYEPVMNWRGDRNHLRSVAASTARVMAILGALAIVLACIGWLLRRARIVTAEAWRPLMTGVLWLAGLAGTPLYLLRRSEELYFGGVYGFVEDTIYSLIESSFYGQTYFAAQSDVVFTAAAGAVAAFVVVGWVCLRRGHRQAIAAAGSLLGVLGVAAAAVIGQHWLFDTPFLITRTALFFIPLFVLFATFLLDAMARLGRAGKTAAITIAVVSASLAAAHFAVTANVSYTLDWKHDAGTKAMIDDLARVISSEQGPGSRVVLGVEPNYSAAAAFYAQKCRTAAIELHTIPATRGIDFFYVDERNAGSLNVIKRYPVADSVLARPGPPR